MRLKPAILALFIFGCLSTALFAHHAAEGIVDEEIYAMIDEMVADTPHADLVFDDMPPASMSADEADEPVIFSITFQSVKWFQYLVDRNLMLYISMLSGSVTAELVFAGNGSMELNVTQYPDE